jgi:hypothetical protein
MKDGGKGEMGCGVWKGRGGETGGGGAAGTEVLKVGGPALSRLRVSAISRCASRSRPTSARSRSASSAPPPAAAAAAAATSCSVDPPADMREWETPSLAGASVNAWPSRAPGGPS